MRKLIFALTIAMNAAPVHVYELRCQTYYDYWNRSSYSRCLPLYSEQEIYQQRQGATVNDLDRSSGGGTRRAPQAACQAALKAGVSADVTKSYGCVE